MNQHTHDLVEILKRLTAAAGELPLSDATTRTQLAVEELRRTLGTLGFDLR